MPGKMFVNYRRDDAAASAARLRDRLVTAFGNANVFMDVDNLLVGQRFDKELEKALAETDVVLAVIGPRWMGLLQARASSDERDYVREEIAVALKRRLMVIPVLIERAGLPRAADLPEDIREMVLHHKHDISHEHFGRDVETLVAGIKAARRAARRGSTTSSSKRWSLFGAVTGIVLAAIAAVAYIAWPAAPAVAPVSPAATAASVDPKRAEQEHKRLEDLDQELRFEREARTKAEAESRRLTDAAAQTKRELEARQKAEADAAASAKEEERQRLKDVAAEANRKADEAAASHDLALSVTPGSSQSFQDTGADGGPCPLCPKMVVLPAGSFMMGTPEGVPSVKSSNDDRPQHRVTIDTVAVGKFSVTVDEFAAFVKATGYEAPGCNMENHSGFMPGRGTWRSPGFPQTGSHPAVCLNWNDAKAYTAWLSKVTGNTYRLLTEAEWEYAARAGSTTLYFFGDDANELCNYGNGKDLTATTEKHQEFSGVACNDGFVYTAPSGSFKPNAFGLYDMIGNASQWVEDCKSANYQGVPDDGSAVEFPSCDYRTQRGGSWNNVPWYYQSANREAAKPDNRFNTYGLRVAREPKRRGTKLDLWPKGGL